MHRVNVVLYFRTLPRGLSIYNRKAVYALRKIIRISLGTSVKSTHFRKNGNSNTQRHRAHRFSALQKLCKIHKKYFRGKVHNFHPRGTCCVHFTLFMYYGCFLLVYNKKTIANCRSIIQISPRGPPGKVVLFLKILA